jgi:hypothetical protein
MSRNLSFSAFFFVCGIEGLIAAWMLINAPADPKNVFALGFSLTRIIILAGTLLPALIMIALAGNFFRADRNSTLIHWITKRARAILTISVITLVIGGWFTFVPDYRIRSISGYIERARPVLIWLMLISAQTVIASITWIGVSWNALCEKWIAEKKTITAQALIFIIFVIMWIAIALSGIGITPDRLYWNENGVPLLSEQIILAWMITALLAAIIPRLGSIVQTRLDPILFIAIWIITIFAWNAQPIQRSFFLPQPMKPNAAWYPLSDAASYDIGARAILLGNGVNDGKFTDKPLYMLFVAFTRLIGGEQYESAIFVQIIILALMPALLFLIGKELHSRNLGTLLAGLMIFKEINNIRATLDVQVSHSKLFLTEPLTALLLIVFAWIMIRWAKMPSEKSPQLILAGGMIGLAGLTRLNPLLIAPLVALIILPLIRFDFKKWISAVSLFALGALIVFSPWILSAEDERGNNFVWTKIERVIERYTPGIKTEKTPQPQVTREPESQTLPEQEQNPKPTKPSQTSADDSNMLQFAPAHFMHNEIAALFVLPVQMQLHDIRETVNAPLWKNAWQGAITFENGFWIALHLMILAAGIGMAWARQRYAGMIPLAIQLSYHAANGLARTSGSRYLVPVDWVLLLYYAAGLIQIGLWINVLLKQIEDAPAFEPQPKQDHVRAQWIGAAIIVLLAGLALPAANGAIPQTYPKQKKPVVLNAFIQQVDLADQIFQAQQLADLADHKYSRMFKARIFYPRYLDANKGFCVECMGTDRAFPQKDYGRLAMLAIGSYTAAIELPLAESPTKIPDGAEAIVIGCMRGENIDLTMIDALYVYFVEEKLLLASHMPQKLLCADSILDELR